MATDITRVQGKFFDSGQSCNTDRSISLSLTGFLPQYYRGYIPDNGYYGSPMLQFRSNFRKKVLLHTDNCVKYNTKLITIIQNVKIYRTIILPVVLYGCETWSLTLREERRLRVFENRVLRRVFGPKRDGVTGEWRKLHNVKLSDLYSLPNIVRVVKSRRMRWTGHVARMGKRREGFGGETGGKEAIWKTKA